MEVSSLSLSPSCNEADSCVGVFNKAGLRDAQSYFERALTLDEDNVAAKVFLEKVGTLMAP